jgi:Ca-activated chloride channel family protein
MPASRPDHYAALGVRRGATPREIRRAYLAAARKLHPDKNEAPGETELFLQVQQAYEVLSNAKRRAQYDATLPPEQPPDEAAPAVEEPPVKKGKIPQHPPAQDTGPTVLHEVHFSRPNLVRLGEPQMIYLLLEVSPRRLTDAIESPLLNVSLVLDRSTSMQGEKMDLVKAAAVRLMRGLREDDLLSVVAFSDRADLIVPASYQSDRRSMEARIQLVQPGGATEIFQGLQAAYDEVRRGLDPRRVNHIILLTDGHTYGDEQACLQLAEEAAAQGIGVSGLGIGAEWNDIFLDALAGRTGGSSAYIAKPQDIEPALLEKFKTLGAILANDVVLELNPQEGIDLTYAFRIHPEASPIALESSMNLGPVLQNSPLSVLLEYVIQPSALSGESVTLLSGSLKISIPGREWPMPPIRLQLAREVQANPTDDPPPTKMLKALSRLSLYRMQERASAEAEAGLLDRATRTLRNLAANLLSEGEQDLAHTALLEAERMEQDQSWSPVTGKEIKYGTRALLLPDATE